MSYNGEEEVIQKLTDDAERHADRAFEDIKLARTRDEHIRVTARANEARELADTLRSISNLNKP